MPLEFSRIEDYEDYLRDESRRTGFAESISFPVTEEEVTEVVRIMGEKGTAVTLQGARTGITAGAVPSGGHVLNLSRMNRIQGIRFDSAEGSFYLSVQPGVLLADLRSALEKMEFDVSLWSEESKSCLELLRKSGAWMFPPDPTETTASLGGMVACNASGARSFHYGPTRRFVEGLKVVLSDGETLSVRRGGQKARGRAFSVQTVSGRIIEGTVPLYRMPEVKNASGYYVADNMDLIDLFIGSEGTLGVVTEIELRLVKAPAFSFGMMCFFTSEDKALKFVGGIRGGCGDEASGPGGPRPAAIEYFNCGALGLLRRQREVNPAFSEIPVIPDEFHTCIYAEYMGDTEDEVYDRVAEASEVLEACGGSEESTWIASGRKEMERLRFFRHSVPEAVNLTIDIKRSKHPGITKLGTDMAVPDKHLERVVDLYNRSLKEKGLESVMFGHIGNNHIHVNIIPDSMEEYERGRLLYKEWAREVIGMGGTISAEHGVGKIKTELLKEMYGEEGIAQMRRLKELFDPAGMFNPGNLF